MKTLLEAGAKIDEKNSSGATPLMRAVLTYHGNGDVIRLLRKWGADPFAKNNYGISPVESARMVAKSKMCPSISTI